MFKIYLNELYKVRTADHFEYNNFVLIWFMINGKSS